jgi:hypothetical protein
VAPHSMRLAKDQSRELATMASREIC